MKPYDGKGLLTTYPTEVPPLDVSPFQQQVLESFRQRLAAFAGLAESYGLIDEIPQADDQWEPVLSLADRLGLNVYAGVSPRDFEAAWNRHQSADPWSIFRPTTSLTLLPDDAMMTHRDLAEVLGLAPEPLRKRLDRWRRDHISGWQEATEHGRHESKYLYRVGSIRELLSEAISKRASV